ncbi:MAG: phosphoribosylaminoimidazolesuccinocarboxamide synthase [Candidatus Omnitrophica bacterium]|nr:phosphoribosylaminoimidazolesuccinocarboxamide synthase [Candidatus Omnitrophota bacterium]MDD5352914.1 phosphoribosylaminoimidazolesuccinocarboxamide synthase [Candidatus Omnitrophota bacterium]MDD5550513.1 phosphoribosylaminoimidazolesuccinocarboxamide synthase [Candidatus Omnitrophota bacterium]
MTKLEKIYEGKAKILYTTKKPHLLIQYFKDDATAFDATKRGTILEKGIYNNKISAKLFELLKNAGVPIHFVRLLNDREMLVKKVEIIPVEVTVRNITAGGMSKMLGLAEGIKLEKPVLEYHYKNDSLHDPLINDDHIQALKLATEKEMKKIARLSLKINEVLKDFFAKVNVTLVDFKLEFGRFKGKIILADEISPDTCRFWDSSTGEKLDKDRFRRDLGNIEEAYKEMYKRIFSI